MAFKLAELFVDITGRDKPLQGTLGRVKNGLLGIGGMAAGATLGLGGVTVALAGVAAGTTAAVKMGADLEKQYSAIRKTTGLAGEDFERLKRGLQSIGTTMAGVSNEEINEIAGMAGRLGIQGVEGILAYTKAIAQIKIALDDIPAEEAATSIARILNQFKLGPEYALSFASALNKLDDSSTATGRDILDVSNRLAGTAATLGLSPQKLLALSSAAKDAGLENEVAGSTFSQIFGKMASEVDKFAKVAGVSTKQFADAVRSDPIEALKLLLKGVNSLEKLEKFKALSGLKMDGVKASGAILQLNQVAEKLDEAIKTSNDEWKSQASIQKEVEIQGQNTWAQLQLLWNQVQLTGAAIGDYLLPVVKALSGVFGEVAQSIRGTVESARGTVGPWVQWMVDVIDVLSVTFRNWSDIVALTVLDVAQSIDGVQSYMGQFASWLSGQFVNIFLDSIQYIGLAFSQQFLDIGNMVLKFWEAIGMEVPESMKGIADAVKVNLFEKVGFRTEGFEFKEDEGKAAGYAAERQAIMDRMAGREQKRLDDKAALAADMAKKQELKDPEKAKEGTGEAPDLGKKKKGKQEQAKHQDLDSYVKNIQESFFEKKDDKLLKVNQEQLKTQKQLLDAQKNAKPNAAVAAGPA
ncbi:phage tail tape measure protein [Singulisphaera sp. PoT]|uniref:phage tail tape measure protein n=1 Tax=Singulisphaera sp. PoT TaxID=3411797 RepID=UPI003BF5646E